MDIYGPVDKSFETEFYEALQCSSEFVKYQGIVEPNKSTDVIKQYDLMLFLTYWPSEGFPGTILDSFSAGVPVIATDWNCNFEIVKENYTGFKVSIHDFHEVANILIDVFFLRDKIIEINGKSVFHVHQGEGKSYSLHEIKGYYNDLTNKVCNSTILDENGIPINVTAGGVKCYFPITIFQYGL